MRVLIKVVGTLEFSARHLVFNSNIGIDTKENHLKCFECLKGIIIQILMLTLMLGFPNITPISHAMDRARL